MLIGEMDFVVHYVASLNASLKKLKTRSLTQIQCNWLVAVLMGLIVSGSLSWAAFSRRSLVYLMKVNYAGCFVTPR